MNAVGGLSAPSRMGRSSTSAVLAPAACLLPPPATDIAGFGGLQDELLVAYADRLKQGANEARSVGVDVVQHRQATAIEQKKMTEARERQQAAERASHGFWAASEGSKLTTLGWNAPPGCC